jgi:hypothetical protein
MISLIGNVYVIDLYKRDIQIEKEMPLWVFSLLLLLSVVIKLIKKTQFKLILDIIFFIRGTNTRITDF